MLIPYFLFDRIVSIPYLTRIRNKELNNVFVPYYLFYKISVTVEGQLRRQLMTILDHTFFGYLKRVIATPILLIVFIPYFPRIRNKE